MKQPKIPVSVVVVTKNEVQNLPRCLSALEAFDDIVVVDSGSTDGTPEIAKSFHVPCLNFVWNGQYPKKRQWILDNLPLRHDYVFFVDADEEVTKNLCDEIRGLDFSYAGYFVKGAYVIEGKVLRYGLQNNKLCLFHKKMMAFPVVDDLDVPGMGEIEGHYQPILKTGFVGRIGQLKTRLNHYAMEDMERWSARQNRYAMWHQEVLRRRALPNETSVVRHISKYILYQTHVGPCGMFVFSYFLKGGFLDGRRGLIRALSLYDYYKGCQ